MKTISRPNVEGLISASGLTTTVFWETIMATTTPTRRAALGAIAAMPIAISIPSAPSVANTRERVSAELARLIEDYRVKAAAAEDFTFNVWNPACERSYADMAKLPHITADVPNGPSYTTANPTHIAICKGVVGIPKAKQATSVAAQDRFRAARRIVAGQRWRMHQIAKVDQRNGFDQLRIDEARIYSAEDAALDAVEQFPARSLADIAAKFGVMAELARDAGVIVDMVGADLDRLAMREG